MSTLSVLTGHHWAPPWPWCCCSTSSTHSCHLYTA